MISSEEKHGPTQTIVAPCWVRFLVSSAPIRRAFCLVCLALILGHGTRAFATPLNQESDASPTISFYTTANTSEQSEGIPAPPIPEAESTGDPSREQIESDLPVPSPPIPRVVPVPMPVRPPTPSIQTAMGIPSTVPILPTNHSSVESEPIWSTESEVTPEPSDPSQASMQSAPTNEGLTEGKSELTQIPSTISQPTPITPEQDLTNRADGNVPVDQVVTQEEVPPPVEGAWASTSTAAVSSVPLQPIPVPVQTSIEASIEEPLSPHVPTFSSVPAEKAPQGIESESLKEPPIQAQPIPVALQAEATPSLLDEETEHSTSTAGLSDPSPIPSTVAEILPEETVAEVAAVEASPIPVALQSTDDVGTDVSTAPTDLTVAEINAHAVRMEPQPLVSPQPEAVSVFMQPEAVLDDSTTQILVQAVDSEPGFQMAIPGSEEPSLNQVESASTLALSEQKFADALLLLDPRLLEITGGILTDRRRTAHAQLQNGTLGLARDVRIPLLPILPGVPIPLSQGSALPGDRPSPPVSVPTPQRRAVAAPQPVRAEVPQSLSPPQLPLSPQIRNSLGGSVFAPIPSGLSPLPQRAPLNFPTVRLPNRFVINALGLRFPLAVPAPITSEFGWRVHPITGDSRFHAGTDIGAPQGTPVVAAMSGRVEAAGDMGGYGYAVILSHADGTQQTLYGHLSEINVVPGQWVEAGIQIGRVGSTGLSTGPHLHFEARLLTDQGWLAVDVGLQLQYALAYITQTF